MQYIENSAQNFFRYFKETNEGRKLKEKIRWDRYKPDDITAKEFNSTLGSDINNFNHMPLSRGLAKVFCEHNNYDSNKTHILLDAALLHDIGEAKVGDTIDDQKNKNKEKKEKEAFDWFLNKYTKKFKIEQPIVEYLKFLKTEIIFNKDTELGKDFDCFESLGYLRTSLIVFEKSKSKKIDDNFKTNLHWLTLNVIHRNLCSIIKNAEIYPAAKEYLKNNKSTINEIFDTFDIDKLSQLYLTLKNEQTKTDTDVTRMDKTAKIQYQKAKEEWAKFLQYDQK